MDETNSGKTLLVGGSGMLGGAVGSALRQRGVSVIRLVRGVANPRHSSATELHWNPKSPNGEIDLSVIEGVTAVVHLSGANVATHRWTKEYKREIVESRVVTTKVLSETLSRLKRPPGVLVAASAVGFYGDRRDEILDDRSSAGRGFFPELCEAWEAAARPAREAGIRVVHMRFGMVVGQGGALAKMLPAFRLGLGTKLGSGKQWLSWISETDAVAAVLFALDNPVLSGSVNAVAPEPVTNAEFTRELARAVHRPAFFAAPAFALRLALGEMADEALLASTRALPVRLLEAGLQFQHPTLRAALEVALQTP